MTAITLNTADYNLAKNYADKQNISVAELFVLLVRRLDNTEKGFQMKTFEQLSPELQQIVGFAKSPQGNDSGLNGEEARAQYYTEKYGLK